MKMGMDLYQIMRGLKGAPASIFLALVLHGGPQTVKHVCGHTAYSDKVVRQGLARLEKMGLAFFDPDFHAWYPEPQTALSYWLQEALCAPMAESRAEAHSEEALSTELSTELSTGGVSEEKITAVREESSGVGEEFAAGKDHEAAKTAVGENPLREDYAAKAEKSTTILEFSSNAAEENSPAKEESAAASDVLLITTTTTKNPNPGEQVIVSKQSTRPKKWNPQSGTGRRERILKDWLVRGGIGERSPKMRELLARGLDLETVKAHVLERLAWEAGLITDGPPYKPGLLILKLLSGDPPPPMRCEDCLRLPNQQGLCGCDYEILMQR